MYKEFLAPVPPRRPRPKTRTIQSPCAADGSFPPVQPPVSLVHGSNTIRMKRTEGREERIARIYSYRQVGTYHQEMLSTSIWPHITWTQYASSTFLLSSLKQRAAESAKLPTGPTALWNPTECTTETKRCGRRAMLIAQSHPHRQSIRNVSSRRPIRWIRQKRTWPHSPRPMVRAEGPIIWSHWASPTIV